MCVPDENRDIVKVLSSAIHAKTPSGRVGELGFKNRHGARASRGVPQGTHITY